MSVEAMTWAFNVKDISDGAKLLLLLLADYADDDNSCWPSRRTLSERLGKSADTIDRRVAELEEAGLVSLQNRTRASRSGKLVPLTNVYVLNVGAAAPSRTSAGSRKSAATEPSRTSAATPSRKNAATLAAPVAATLAADLPAHIDKPPIRTPIEPSHAASASARAGEGLLFDDPNVEPSDVVVIAAPARSPSPMRAWFKRLVEEAGPGLADPDKHSQLITTMSELDRWSRAGVDLELDAVPVVAGITRRADAAANPIKSWKYFTEAVTRAAAERRAELTIPTIDATEPRHGKRAYDPRSPRQRADDNRRKGMLAALFDTDEGWPGPDACGTDDPDPGALRPVGFSRAV